VINEYSWPFSRERYGDFVLSAHPSKQQLISSVWSVPCLLGGGLFRALIITIKNRGAQIQEEPLSPDEHRRAARTFAGASLEKESAMISFWLIVPR